MNKKIFMLRKMLKKILFVYICVILSSAVLCMRKYTSARKAKLRDEVRGMFQHAYDGYLRHASDYDELRPLTCDGINTWGSYSLTLIDALDTLAVMGNFSEFRHVADIIIKKVNFDNDINVSVFETNIRIVGGLLSAHLLAHKAGMDLEPGWPCNGPLLRLAEDVAKRLLPAFDTKTGMPYGTVNLKHGVPPGETPVTCTAGVGTFIVEFGALSRLTGDPIYEEVALNAIYSLWDHRSQIGLLGNHINVQTGRWTAQDAGIGAGVDSFFEYLVKGSILLNRPDLLEMFYQARNKIDKYMKRDDWYVWVSMNKGQVTLPVFQSLEAYWPGVLSLINDIRPAMQTLHNYHTVWRQYGFLPELYNIPGTEAGANRESYPLRPELAESAMYLYRATKDPYLLEIGEDMLRSIQYSAKTSCGYSTIRNVRDHRKDNRMESFFLSETTKYLYLLFDDENFLHNNGGKGSLLETPNGICIIEAGGYVFNTEAHPMDLSALSCCYELPKRDIFANFDVANFQGDLLRHNERKKHDEKVKQSGKYSCPDPSIVTGSNKFDTNLSIDIEVLDSHEKGIHLAKEMLDNFQNIQMEDLVREQQEKTFSVEDFLAKVNNITLVDEMPTMLLEFMKNSTIPPNRINKVFQMNTSAISIDLTKCKTLWGLYVEYHRFLANIIVYEALGLQKFDKDQNETSTVLNDILLLLNSLNTTIQENNNSQLQDIFFGAQRLYAANITNVSKMLYFTILLADDANESELQSQIWKTIEKLNTLPEQEIPVVTNIDLELFEKLYEYAKFKKRMIDTLNKLHSLMEYSEKINSDQVSHSEVRQIDDIISIAEKNHEIPKKQMEAHKSQSELENKHSKQMEEATNNSILTEFVQSFIKSSIPSKPKFDEQMFLKRIRAQMSYINNTNNYETLTCDTPKFAERFTYRYEV